MDELIINILEYAYPAQESIKDSDFSANVKNLTDYIISIFRNVSLQYVQSFLNGFLLKIESDAKSEDKRKRYASAVCVSSLFDLFPIDEYISQYKKVVEPLLVPGYKPMLHVGAIVVGRLALIIGDSKDLFLHNLVLKCFNDLQVDNQPDARYAAAVIWNELAKTVPEIFYTLDNFEWIILENLQSGDRVICELLINVIYSLFTSESSSVGSDFLIELQDLLITTTSKNFSDSLNNDKIIIYFQLLNFLLKIKPYFSKRMAENLLFSKCVSLLRSKNFEIVLYSIETIIRLYEFKTIKIEKNLYDEIVNVLFEWSKESPSSTLQTLEKMLFSFPGYLNESSDTLITRLPPFLKIQGGPLFVYNLIVTIIASLPPTSNVVNYLTFIIKMMPKSNVPIPIYTILRTLNNKRSHWTRNFIYFMNQVMYVIRQELISQSANTIRLNIALLGLTQIPIRDLDDALELNSLIMALVPNKDIQVREKIAEASLHLFTQMPDKIPLNTIIKLVKFALDDTARSVRLNSIRAFNKQMTYKLLSQPDIFPIFSRFAYDESPDVRKEAFLIFASLPSVTGTVVRNILLSSLKQISSEKECLTPETIPMWICFPRLLVAATPWLDIYAEAIYEKFINILDYRFSSLLQSEVTLVHMNSAMFQEMDESLIKSIAKLYRICPDLIEIKPILSVYIKILNCPVHPRTKIHVLKSLKNLGKISPLIKIMPNIAAVIIDLVLTSRSRKVVVKAMKVVGAIGYTQFKGKPPNYSQFFFRNSLTNQKVMKFYFISNLVNFLNDEFKSTNIEKNRENITRAMTTLFKQQPEMIARYLEPFFGNYLKFVHDSSERPPVFFKYLKKMIERGGHLMMEKAKIIYNSIQRDWQSSGPMTKESSEVFRSLVKATIGQCEVILNTLISESFFLLKIPNKSHLYATEVFELLKTIAQLSPSYLSTILSGIAEFLNQSYSSNIQELSLDSIKFMLHHCKIDNHLSFIKRCINSILQRPQQRFKDKATYLLNEVNSVTRSQSIEKLTSISMNNTKLNRNTSNSPSIKTIDQIHAVSLNISKFVIHLDINKIIGADDNTIFNWFIELSNFLLPPSSSELIESMSYLQKQPEFKFEFSFIQIWNHLELLTQKEIALKIEAIFKYDKLPNLVLLKFVNLIEFSILCEINLGVNILLVAGVCEKAHLYDKALFLLETYLIYYPNNKTDDKFEQSLVCMNQIVGRSEDAHSIALRSKEVMTHETWMKLGEWELALSKFDENKIKEDPNHFIIDRIICYAALDDWDSIMKLTDQFDRMQVFEQSCVAQYFWTAKSYSKSTLDNSLLMNSFNMSCGYSVKECVDKAILNIKDNNNIAQAYQYVHLGWRYASALIMNESKNYNNYKIDILLFRAQQLYELNNTINLIRNNKLDVSLMRKSEHIWNQRLKFLKTETILQKELYKICSLVNNDKEGLELFSFRILQSTFKGRYAPLIPTMTKIFFPDSQSDQAQFAAICYNTKNGIDSVEKAKEIYNRTDDLILKKLIDEFVGKKIYVFATKSSELEKAFEYFSKAESNIKTLIKCNILLAYVKNDSSYARKVVELLSDQKVKLSSIHLHDLLILLSNFDVSLESIINRIAEIDLSVLQSASYTMISLLDHESENVKSCCKEMLSYLCVHWPQPIIYDLINNIQLTGVKDLILQLQSYNPSVSSQMILIARKLTNISNNLYEKWIKALKKVSEFVKTGDKTEAMKTILRLKHTLEINGYVSVSKYNKEFLDTYRKSLLSLIEQIEKNHSMSPSKSSALNVPINLNLSSSFSLNSSSIDSDFNLLPNSNSNSSTEFDISATNLLLSQMMKKQASQRVIPISSFDEEFEKKSDWILDVFGLKGVKINRVFNCLQRIENGFKVSFIASNGKKYNFSLENIGCYYSDHRYEEENDEEEELSDQEIARKIKLSEQFMDLLSSTVTTVTRLTKRTIVELSSEVLLIDLMKGHIPLYDLVVSYYAASHTTKENALTYEMATYMKNVYSRGNGNNGLNRPFSRANSSIIAEQSSDAGKDKKLTFNNRSSSNADFANKMAREKKFRELQVAQDPRAIAKAIVATSRDSMSWIQRSSAFAKSFGTLAFISHVIGGVDMSPHAIAFDKYSANVSYTSFLVRGKPQNVPFRLTRMIIGALGSGCTTTTNNNNNNNNNDNDNNTNDSNKKLNAASSNDINGDVEKFVVGGPFVAAFEVSLRSLRRQKGLFSPCLQFFLQSDSLKKKVIPNKAIERFTDKDENEEDKVFTDNENINKLYSRIDGEKATIKNDINNLIEIATNPNNLIRMPPKWIPWW